MQRQITALQESAEAQAAIAAAAGTQVAESQQIRGTIARLEVELAALRAEQAKRPALGVLSGTSTFAVSGHATSTGSATSDILRRLGSTVASTPGPGPTLRGSTSDPLAAAAGRRVRADSPTSYEDV